MIDMPKALKLIRAVHGWDQQAMATAANIHSTAISRMESGKRKPNIKSIEKIARAAGIPFELLASFATTIEDPKIADERNQRFLKWIETHEHE